MNHQQTRTWVKLNDFEERTQGLSTKTIVVWSANKYDKAPWVYFAAQQFRKIFWPSKYSVIFICKKIFDEIKFEKGL